MFRSLLLSAPVALAVLGSAGCPEPTPQVGVATAPQTSRMQISHDGKTLYVALADHGLVRAIDADSGRQVGEVAVDGYPHRLTVLDDGRVAVSQRYAGTVSIVDVEKGTVDAVADVGADPYGLVQLDHDLVVAVSGEGDLARIDLANPTVVASRVVLHSGDPRGIAVLPDGKLVVSHFTAGVLSVVDGDALREVDMHLPSKQFFFPNQMGSVTANVDGTDVTVPHVECNNDPAQFLSGGTNLAGEPAFTYYVDGPTGYPAVSPAISHVDPQVGLITSDEDRSPEEAIGTAPEHEGAVAPVIDSLNRNLLGDTNVNGPQEMAYADDGNLELVVARGSGNVIIRRPTIGAGDSSIVGEVKMDVGVSSIQVSPDGKRAFVYNEFNDTVSTFAIPASHTAKSKFAGGAHSSRIQQISVEKSFTVAEPVLPRDVRQGRVLFHSVDDRLTHFGSISCDSCHPGGAADGTTWHFAEGPRQSPALYGGILGTEPFHWDQSVPDMAGISDVTIVGRMGGAGLGRADMNLIGQFLDQLPAPSPPRTAANADVGHGAQLFFSEAVGCTTCHMGDNFTDDLAHDVGTGNLNPNWGTGEETIAQFATPVLHGLAASAPYLHDGSARTLDELVERLVATNQMGKGATLSQQDKADLVAFLKTL